jgi:transposase-like protein
MNATATEGSKTNGAHAPLPKAKDGERRTFSEDYKLAALQRIKKGETVGAVSEAIGVHESVIRRWFKSGGLGARKAAKAQGALPKGVAVGPHGRKEYSEAFQRAAVARVHRGEGVQKVCDSLGIHNSMLYNWRDKFAKNPKKAAKKTSPPVRQGHFSDEAKREAVERLSAGETSSALGRELGISAGTVSFWRDSFAKKNAKAAGKSAGAGASLTAHPAVRDAVTYLKHVKTDMYALLQSGVIKEFDEYHLNTLAALKRLLSIV